MRTNGLVATILAAGLLTASAVQARPRAGWIAVPGDPWSHVLYGPDGTLEAARGRGSHGVPLSLEIESSDAAGSLRATLRYVRGRQSLRIDRTLDPLRGFTVSFRTDMESWTLSILPDEASGGALALYTLTGGRTFSFWVDAAGNVTDGDLEALRRTLDAPSVIRGLLRHYSRDRQALAGLVPSVGESAVLALPQKSCEDACAEGCSGQCAWECVFWGLIGCRICNISCALGCAIGC
jgi:hypothetical protein